jgi:hypothetical protein
MTGVNEKCGFDIPRPDEIDCRNYSATSRGHRVVLAQDQIRPGRIEMPGMKPPVKIK